MMQDEQQGRSSPSEFGFNFKDEMSKAKEVISIKMGRLSFIGSFH